MFKDYLEVLKPRETALLTFIAVAASFIASNAQPEWPRLGLVALAVLMGSAGTNGLTNYLDRKVDGRMPRTWHRALAAGRIKPAEKALVPIIILILGGLGLAWYLHPYAFIAGAVGVIASSTFRKKVVCVFPQGAIASCAPIAVGWLAMSPTLTVEFVLICLVIIMWLPLHVWSVMIGHREEYLNAGLTFFPMNTHPQSAVKIIFLFSLALYGVTLALYFSGNFSLLYLVVANLLGIAMVYSSLRLVTTGASTAAWRLYKLSAFPYLGILFLTMSLDVWLG